MAAAAAWLLPWAVPAVRAERPQPRQQAEALRLIEELAAGMKLPLNTIRGFSELIAGGAQGATGEAELRNSCRFIVENSRVLSAFLGQLQDFARYEQGRLRLAEQQVEAGDLVEAALAACRDTAERADVVIVASLTEGIEIRCDAVRIGQAVSGMVSWAAASAAPGSMLAVKLVKGQGGSLAISVSGTAQAFLPGLPQEGPFEPRLARDGLSGLALPVARRVALLHSGDLTIDSEPGALLAARLTLPPHRVVWPGTSRTADSSAA